MSVQGLLLRVAFAAIVLLTQLLSPAAAQDAAARARAAAEALADATDALQEAVGADDRVASLTRTIRAYEDGLEALRGALRDAALRETTLARRFEARSTELSRLLAALMAIGRTQQDVQQLLLHPAGPLGTARAGILLAEVTPALGAEAARLREDLREVAQLRATRADAAALLLDGLEAAQAALAELGRAMSDRTDLPRRFVDNPDVMVALAEAAETLDAFARGLAGRSALVPGPAMRDFAQARGTIGMPVSGALLRGANEPDAAGIARPGLVLATAAGALVTAPWSATIRYAGPLRGYANVIILEPGDGYLLVLGGLDRLYAVAGEVVAKGSALGLMGGTTGDDPGLVSGERTETLYIELRHRGEPVDPAPWFALSASAQ